MILDSALIECTFLQKMARKAQKMARLALLEDAIKTLNRENEELEARIQRVQEQNILRLYSLDVIRRRGYQPVVSWKFGAISDSCPVSDSCPF